MIFIIDLFFLCARGRGEAAALFFLSYCLGDFLLYVKWPPPGPRRVLEEHESELENVRIECKAFPKTPHNANKANQNKANKANQNKANKAKYTRQI